MNRTLRSLLLSATALGALATAATDPSPPASDADQMRRSHDRGDHHGSAGGDRS